MLQTANHDSRCDTYRLGKRADLFPGFQLSKSILIRCGNQNVARKRAGFLFIFGSITDPVFDEHLSFPVPQDMTGFMEERKPELVM